MYFTIDVQISLVNFIKVLGFLLLAPKKKGCHTFLNVYFSVINIYCFFNGHVHCYCSWNIFDHLFKCLRFFKGSFHAILQFHSHKKIQKKTHTPHCFSLKNHGQSFYLKHLLLQFNFRIHHWFYFCEQSLSEEIRGILLCKNEFCKNLYLPKYIFRKNLFL